MPSDLEKWLYAVGGFAAGILVAWFYIEFMQYHPPTPPEVEELASMVQSVRNQQHADEEQMLNVIRKIEEFNDKNLMTQGQLEDDIISIRNYLDKKEKSK